MNTRSYTENQIVQESLFTALIQLMQKKEFHNITITEITEKAGVSRMSYYRNYSSKEDILIKYLDRIFDEYLTELLRLKKCTKYDIAKIYFSNMRRHKQFWITVIRSNISYLIPQKVDIYINDLFEKYFRSEYHPKAFKEYIFDYYAGGLYKTSVKWIQNGMKESDEEMAELICRLSDFIEIL